MTIKTCGIKYKDYERFHQHTNFKDNLVEHKCLCCNKNCQKKKTEKKKPLQRNDFLIQL